MQANVLLFVLDDTVYFSQNLEPANGTLEEEMFFGNHHFQVKCQFSRVVCLTGQIVVILADQMEALRRNPPNMT